MLYYTGLYGNSAELDKTFVDWRKQYQENKEKEKRAEERKNK